MRTRTNQDVDMDKDKGKAKDNYKDKDRVLMWIRTMNMQWIIVRVMIKECGLFITE